MSNIIPIGAQHYDGLTCLCGGGWFYLVREDGSPGAVVMSMDRQVTGYMGYLVCTWCGAKQTR